LGSGAPTAGRAPRARRQDTLVTTVYELEPAAPLGGRHRPLAYYFPSLRSIAALGAGLVVYTWPAHVEQVATYLHALDAPAVVVGRELESAPRYAQIQEIRTRQEFHTKPWRDRCHVLCHAKLAWLAEQAALNPFTSERCYWIDAGLAYPGLFPRRYLPDYLVDRCALFTPRVLDALREADGPPIGAPPTSRSARSLVLIGKRPPEGPLLHNIPLDHHLAFSGHDQRPIDTHVVGALFGGAPERIPGLYSDYDGVLAAMLAADLLGTEENVLTILYHRDPSSVMLLPFTTWYHQDSHLRPEPGELPFYHLFEALAGQLT
jgi:hypothetical protein